VNAESIPTVFPGWVGRFYCGQSVPADVTAALAAAGSEVVMMNEEGDWTGMFWRFLAASDESVEVMLSRDADSRLSKREFDAVSEWMSSSRAFHAMRDHPLHTAVIMGGMWGVKAPLLRDIESRILQYARGNFWQVDQNFLRDVIWPIVKDDAMVHDSFGEGLPFPGRRNGSDFVGQVVDEYEIPNKEYADMLVAAIKKRRWGGLGRFLP